MSRKQFLYNEAKNLAQNLYNNRSYPKYVGSSIKSLEEFIAQNSRRALPFLADIRASNVVRPVLPFLFEIQSRIISFIGTDVGTFKYEGDALKLKNYLLEILEDNKAYYVNVLGADEFMTIRFTITRAGVVANNSRLHNTLFRILATIEDYFSYAEYINIQIHEQINENPALENIRNGAINCACKVVLDSLHKLKQTDRTKGKIKAIEKINNKYFESGIDSAGIQELSDKSYMTLVVKDKIGEIWNEFKPKGKDKKGKTLLLVAHNNHVNEIYDSDDDEPSIEQSYSSIEYIPNDYQFNSSSKMNIYDKNQKIVWFDNNQDVIDIANAYEEKDDDEPSLAIISKGSLVAFITASTVWKTKFPEYEEYPECFTAGGVGKGKFLKQYPQYQDGCSQFSELLLDASKSGFYSRTAITSELNTKYDQNKSYKSFKSSGLFNGFPIIEAVFTVDKLFSEFQNPVCETQTNGLIYIESETLTVEKLNQHIYYETSGWYPIEIVQENYKTHGINPFVKSYAYASETFDVNFDTFTNEQFRSFIGKCVSKSFEESWRTNSYSEYMRARYVLKDRILSLGFSKKNDYEGWYSVTYSSTKSPWNVPVISAYVKAHQKFILFKQYNKLIDNNIVPICVNVDGIEVSVKCDHLFDIGTNNGQWKLEKIRLTNNPEQSVIERIIAKPRGEIQYSKDLILPKFLHISGAGGNGKTNRIIELAKVYPYMMFMAPTHDAVKNLKDRAKELNVNIRVDTYYKVFGINCRPNDRFDHYTRFVLDECSMVPAEHLTIMMKKLKSNSGFLMAGDFHQLPCIAPAVPIYDNWTCIKSEEYKKFEVMELTENYRQKEDPKFFDLCNKLRGELSKNEALSILKILNTRSLESNTRSLESNIMNKTLDDIHICGINTQINAINDQYELKKGCKVICNDNCKDLENNFIPLSSIGIITECSSKTNIIQICWAGNVFDPKTTSTFKGNPKAKNGKLRFTAAYALTVHKAQGKTIKNNVIINPSRLFAKNHLYVALTRATKFSSIFFTEKMSFETFCNTVHVNLQKKENVNSSLYR